MGVRERYENNKKNNSIKISTGVKGRYDKKKTKLDLEQTISFDTFESDLSSLGTTIKGIYEGWQTEETMNNTRLAIEDMQKRIKAYQDYQKTYGGTDISDIAKSYDEILKGWGNRTALYKQYKDADSYTKEQKKLSELDAMTLEEIAPLLKDKKNPIAYTTYSGQDITWQSLYDEKDRLERSTSIRGEGGWRKYLQDEIARAQYEEENEPSFWEKILIALGDTPDPSAPAGISTNQIIRDKAADTSYQEPKDDWKREEKNIFGSYYLEDVEKAYDYAANLNNQKALEKKNKSKLEVASNSTDGFWGAIGNWLGAVASAPLGLADLMDDVTDQAAGRRVIVEEDFLTPFEYSQTVTSSQAAALNEISGTIDEDVPIIGGKGLGDVYGLGTSVAQSFVSANTLGSIGTAISYFGQGAASSVDDALSRGATPDEALLYGFVNGSAEAVSEYIGADRLLKIGDANTIKELLINAFVKQPVAEGLEETFSAVAGQVADNFIMKERSNFQNLVRTYQANGMSKDDAVKKAWGKSIGEVAYSTISGYLSGGIHGLLKAPGVAYMINFRDKAIGQTIRGNERVNDLLGVAQMTPRESEAYNLYTDYAVRNNPENISDKQIGRLYTALDSDARDTLSSKKTTSAQKEQAIEVQKQLSSISEENAIDKGTIDKMDEQISRVRAYHSEAENLIAQGLESDKETKSYKLAEQYRKKLANGEELTDQDIAKLVKANDEAIRTEELDAFTKTLSKEDANLFKEVYDGNPNLESFANSFNLVKSYAENNFSQDYILEHRGALSPKQVGKIYSAKIVNKDKSVQNMIAALKTKHSGSPFIEGTFNDSIINYGKGKVEGKVNWSSLNTTQQRAIAVLSALGKGMGFDVELISDGLERGINGAYVIKDNKMLIDVYAGMPTKDIKDAPNTIIPTLSHEMTHWMKPKSPELYRKLDNFVFDTLMMGGKPEKQILDERRAKMEAAHPGETYTDADVRDEVIARACEDMFANSEEIRKYLETLTDSEKKTFVDKVKEILQNIKKWLGELLSQYKSESPEAQMIREQQNRIAEQVKLWDAALKDALTANQALKKEGIIAEDIIAKDLATKKMQFNERLVETHIDKLKTNYSEESALPLDTLLERYAKVVDMWKELGGELNSQFLEDWNNKKGNDRTFSVFKAQAGYKYNVELSSMCKKGIPLFEAIDKIVKEEAMRELRTRTLGKAEKEILYDILKSNNFEIPCAICYVEQARQREGVIIDAFLNGKIEKTASGKVTQFKLGWNETLANVQKVMQKAGCDFTFPSLDRNVATDNYKPADLTMDEETQKYFFDALKKIANEEIRRYNKAENKSRKLITRTDAKSINEVFKGKLPLNLAMFKVMFNEPSSRFMIDDDLLYSSMTTQNLAASHNGLYGIFNSQGGVGGYKTKQGTIVYWADILNKKWTPSKLRDEGGVRNQSNSDFLMYTMLDQAQMYIDFTAKGYYLQAYTKVLAELKLFGLSKGKINASFIPKVEIYRNADGSVNIEKTQANAGLDKDGNPIYDDIEGINHKEAFMLVEDAEYSKSIGGVCIGYSDKHISKLLDDKRIQLIIGFHDKTNDSSKRYQGAKYSKNYNGLNEATKYDKDGTLKTVHIGFNQFVRKAEGKFKSKDTIEYNGKTYKYNDIPKLATDLYLEHCESKGLFPAYSQGGTDFSKHPNYYKLLADFSLYDINGNYAPHQRVEFNMPTQVPYLDENGNKAYMPTKDYVKKELSKELTVRDDISTKLADKSENGIIPQFIKRANDLYENQGMQFADRDLAPTFYSQMGKTISEMKQDKIGANSVVSYLKGRGVKNEEIKWSGIETFLDGKKSVTKSELQEFVAGSMLQIEEDTFGRDTFKDFYEAMSDASNIHITRQQFAKNIQESDGGYNKIAQLLEWTNVSEEKKQDVLAKYKIAVENFGKGEVAKWGDYKLDGGSNYREIVFTMPNSSYTNPAMEAHWGKDTKGVLAHARIQDFEVNGKKMLFIEEIQSDWHNMGHKVGYKSDVTSNEVARLKEIESQISIVENEMDAVEKERDAFLERYWAENLSELEYNRESRKWREREYDLRQKQQDLYRERNEYKVKVDNAAPDAPFKDNYHEYVLKRLIRMAAEEGYDSIGWTTAEIQSNRWSDDYAEGYRIEYDQDIPKFLKKYGKQWGAKVGHSVFESGFDGERLYTDNNSGAVYTEEELNNKAKQLVEKQYNEVVTEIDIGVTGAVYVETENHNVYIPIEVSTTHGTKVWSMVITDTMKNSVLYEGQVMYSDRDSVGNTLTKEQSEFFKDSKVRDEDGNLLVMYHGTDNGGFTIFDPLKSDDKTSLFLTASKEMAQTYAISSKEISLDGTNNQSGIYSVYANITNPYVVDAKGSNWNKIRTGINPFSQSTRDIAQKAKRKGYDGVIIKNLVDAGGYSFMSGEKVAPDTVVIAFDSNQIKDITNKIPTSNPDIRYSDRDNVSIYDRMGETDRLIQENEQLKADVERLKERLKIERQVTHGNYFNENQLNAVAGHIRHLVQSTYNKTDLIEHLRDVYSYIAHSEELNWDDLFAKCYDVARYVMQQAAPITEENEYAKMVMKAIRGARFSVNEQQVGDAKHRLGKHWRNSFMGKFTIVNEGTSLDRQWQEWAEKFPDIFDAEISDAQMLVELYDIWDSLKASSETVIDYYEEERTRQLAREIYNQYWNVSPIRTTADKYDKQIKLLNFKHRQTMKEFRDDYDARLKAQHKSDMAKSKELVKKVREQKDKEIAKVKQLGKERMDAYKERAASKTLIQGITANALTLNKWLTKNSKEYHIHEAMKGPVLKLLQAIDFSSKRMLEKNIPTQNDISLKDAFRDIQKMLDDAQAGNVDLVDWYGHDLGESMKMLVDAAYNIVGDNHYVINQMSLEELQNLDRLVKYIKKVVTQFNKFHTVQHQQGIANLSQEQIVDLDSLGEGKEYSGFRGKLSKVFKWDNLNPYHAFNRLGKAGRKVFEALQDGWDRLAFNVKLITDFVDKTYTSKEVKSWGKETKTFTVAQPDGSNRTFKMTIAQIMAFHCVSKQPDAMRHLLSRGMTLASFEENGKVVKDKKNILLTEDDIDMIRNSLTDRQKGVANQMQIFMNTICSDWGNEVSMKRFGIKMFGLEDYFPIKVSPAAISKEEPTDVSDTSLFRLLNMSFTKSRNEFADQSIEIGNIFDIFAQHTSDMAKYNALALPVLDAYRWYSYKGKTLENKEYSVYASMQTALGEESVRYFNTFLKDLNGSSNVARDNFGSDFFRNAKIAAVAFNIRTVFLQPTSYLRASVVLGNKYLAKALLHKPKIAKAEKYCGMALWKSLGYYDVNISRGLTQKIKHDETAKDKIVDVSMKGMEIADKVTMGYLWNACELEIRATRKDLKVGSEEFYAEIGKKLRDVIYASQVVDSTMTRSQIMRSPDGKDKMLTAFMSEATLSYNMLMDVFTQASLDTRKYGKEESWKRNGKKVARVISAYVVTNLVCALVESGFYAFRDDDDEEKGIEEFMKIYIGNFGQDISIIGKVPYIKEIISAFQGYRSSRTDTQWMYSFANAAKSWYKILIGDGDGEGAKLIKNTLRSLSDLTGIAGYNIYRDLAAALDKLDILSAEELEEMLNDIFE